jgi:hypothetical protein
VPIQQSRPARRRDADLAFSIDHDVGGFEVAMEHATLVCRGESCAQLTGEIERLVFWQPPDAAEQGREVLAVHILHREKRQPVHLADVVHPADVLVRDLPGEAHFGVELREADRVGLERRGQELHGDGLTEGQVVGAIDLSHAALTDARHDPIPTGEQGARFEAAVRTARRGRQRQPAGR